MRVNGSPSLENLDGASFRVFFSAGFEAEAQTAAARAAKAVDWLTSNLGGKPDPVLYVVGPDDWPRVASIPLYGMPHAFGNKVVLGTVPAPFWQDIVKWFLPHVRAETRARLHHVYGDPPNLASVFPELVVVHELAHLYHEFDEATERTDFPQLWLAELFANLGLYGYVSEVEPDKLPILETICEAAQEMPRGTTPVRALTDMGRSFEYENGAALYCWFEFMLIMGAKRLWRAAGATGFRAFYTSLRRPDLSMQELVERLGRIHPEAALLVTGWPE